MRDRPPPPAPLPPPHRSGANVQLEKAVRTNKSARKYMLAFFVVASLGLLFLDWFYS